MQITDLMPDVVKLTNGKTYADVQTAEFEKIITGCLINVMPQKRPNLLQISGIPGAGKSTYWEKEKRNDYLFISFDEIMQATQGYQKDCQQVGLVQAFARWELPARLAGYELLRRAINKRVHIALEHSGVNPAHIQLFKNLKKMGYSTQVVFLVCSPQIAAERTVRREQETQRHTPLQLILDRAKDVSEYLIQYQAVANWACVIDTSKNKWTVQKSYWEGIPVFKADYAIPQMPSSFLTTFLQNQR